MNGRRRQTIKRDEHDELIIDSYDDGEVIVSLENRWDGEGMLIGRGRSRDEAIREAVAMLEWATEQLQGPPP